MTGRLLVGASLLLTSGCVFFEGDSGSVVDENNTPSGDMDVISTDMGVDADTTDMGGGGEPDQAPEDLCATTSCDAPGLVCQGGDCVCDEAACGAVGQDGQLFVCHDGECVASECEGDDGCEPGQRCNANFCEEIVCSTNEECGDESLVCVNSGCIVKCEEDTQCAGENNGCVDGLCVDLLSDPQHCGDKQTSCAAGSACVDGLCLCGNRNVDMNAKPVNIFSGANYKVWPEAQLIAYPTAARYRCATPDVMLDMCPGQDVIFNEDYPLKDPHFIAVSVEPKFSQPDALTLRVLDGRGEKAGDDVTIEGLADSNPGDIINYRFLELGPEAYLLFVQRRFRDRDRVRAYMLTVKNGVRLVPITVPTGNVAVWVEEPNMTDFSVTARVGEGGFLRVGMAYTTMKSGLISDGGKLSFMVFDLRGTSLNAVIEPASYEFEEMRQFSEGMSIVMDQSQGGGVVARVLAYDSKSYERLQLPDRDFHIKAYSNVYTFKVEGNQNQFTFEEDSVQTMGRTYVNSLDVLGAALSGDRTVLPASPYLFTESRSGNLVLQRLGWDFVAPTGQNMLRTESNFSELRMNGFDRVVLKTGEANLRVFDAALAIEGREQIFVHQVEQTADVANKPARVVVYGLTENATTMQGEYTAGKNLTPEGDYRRISAVTGPHATGVLVASSARDVGADLYFVAQGGEPVCQ